MAFLTPAGRLLPGRSGYMPYWARHTQMHKMTSTMKPSLALKMVVVGTIATAMMYGCATVRQTSYLAPLPSMGVAVKTAWRGLPEIAGMTTAAGTIDFALFETASEAEIRLVLLVQPGHSIRLGGRRVTATSETGEVVTATISEVSSYVSETGVRGRIVRPSDQPLAGAAANPQGGLGGIQTARRFEIVAKFDATLTDRLTLRLPEFDIDGSLIELPATTFEHRRGTAYIGTTP